MGRRMTGNGGWGRGGMGSTCTMNEPRNLLQHCEKPAQQLWLGCRGHGLRHFASAQEVSL